MTVKIGALGVLGLFMVLKSFLSYLPHILFDKRLRFNGILLAVKSAIYSLKNLLKFDFIYKVAFQMIKVKKGQKLCDRSLNRRENTALILASYLTGFTYFQILLSRTKS